jgi:PAS domain S-box-containing protein
VNIGLLLVLSCLSLGLLLSIWQTRDVLDQPGAIPFVLFQTGALLVQLLTLVDQFNVFPTWVRGIGTLGIPMLLLWAAFAGSYTGRGPVLTRSRSIAIGSVVCLNVGIISLALLPVPEWLAQSAAAVGSIISVFPLFAGVSGSLLLLWAGFRDAEIAKPTGIAFGGYGLATLLYGPIGVYVLPVALGGVLLIQFRCRPFDGQPAMAYLTRETALETMDDPVVVVDRDDRIADLNAVAERTFGLEIADVVGRPLQDVIESDLTGDDTGPVSIDTTAGHRSFDVTCSPLRDNGDKGIGRTFIFRDVTNERTREEQLRVFNRVLRHNLRNDLDAIRGFAETLDEEDGGGPFDAATVADRIHSLSRDLSETGATAKRAERLRTQETLGYDQVSVHACVESVADEIRQASPDCVVVTRTPTSTLQLQTDESILRTVLFEVVENAVEHPPVSDPTVEVTAESAGDGVTFTVRDEGPGIPEHDRAVLLDETKTPTQKQHSTGIGLWLVSWGITRLGGELDITNADTGGAVVTLSIPNRDTRIARRSRTATPGIETPIDDIGSAAEPDLGHHS